VGVGLHSDFETAVAEMTRLGQTFEPNLQVYQIYNEIYRKVYLKMYNRLYPLYRSLQSIIHTL
jgi:sugar (pentulose or hexulose) kinase